MIRKAYDDLRRWKDDPERKPLIILGCRQVGKTYLVKEFGRREYESCIYLNFADNPDDRLLFEGNLDVTSLVDRLILSKNIDVDSGNTLLILDEIQDCDDAYYSLKPLSTDRRLDVIATGSFLGVLLDSRKRNGTEDEHRVSPMGYARMMYMHPMDFEEFAWAMGVNPDLFTRVRSHMSSEEPLDTYFNRMLQDLFKRYLVVGGMPEAVRVYSETQDYNSVMERLDDILNILLLDAGRYSSKGSMMRIHACLKSIPSQLADDKRSFQYYDIEKVKGAGKRTYGSSIDWLVNAGIALKCRNLLSVDPPLDVNAEEDTYKLYLCDTGLFMALCRYQDVQEIILGDPFTNNGILMENAVANALHRKGYQLYYHSKRNSTLEVDFVMKYHGRVCIMEVKSGRNKRSKSMNTLLSEDNRNRTGIKVCEGNIERDRNGALHLPLYGACLIDGPSAPDVPSIDIDAINRMSVG